MGTLNRKVRAETREGIGSYDNEKKEKVEGDEEEGEEEKT